MPYSRSQLARRIDAGEVWVAGQVAKPAQKLRRGQTVVFVPAPVVETEDRAEAIGLDILFEDEFLVVLDKPAGMVVHPATSHQSGTLVNALLHHLGDRLRGIGGERRPGIVHRIDKDTSGVLVVAKDESTLVGLQKLFARHDLERRYLALVMGQPPVSGTFDTGYGRDLRDRKKFSSKMPGGKRALTHYWVRESMYGTAWVETKLETGRTHQIRVHFKDAGYPLFGDQVYGRIPKDNQLRDLWQTLGRQALHAFKLGFVHPQTGQYHEWTSPVPADLEDTLEHLRRIKS